MTIKAMFEKKVHYNNVNILHVTIEADDLGLLKSNLIFRHGMNDDTDLDSVSNRVALVGGLRGYTCAEFKPNEIQEAKDWATAVFDEIQQQYEVFVKQHALSIPCDMVRDISDSPKFVCTCPECR